MSTIPQVCAAIIPTVTTQAELAGRDSGLVQRKRKLTGDKLAQILVFGWLNQAQATLEGLSQTASTLGVKVSPQAIDQRFSPAAAAFLERVLQAAVGGVVSAAPPVIAVFQRFKGVLVQDSSVVMLPQELKEVWPGCGGRRGGQSALKLQVRLAGPPWTSLDLPGPQRRRPGRPNIDPSALARPARDWGTAHGAPRGLAVAGSGVLQPGRLCPDDPAGGVLHLAS